MYCNNCRYLSLTEDDQNTIRDKAGIFEPHRCLKYNKVLRHMGSHPNIRKDIVCKIDSSLNNRYTRKDGNIGININLIG